MQLCQFGWHETLFSSVDQRMMFVDGYRSFYFFSSMALLFSFGQEIGSESVRDRNQKRTALPISSLKCISMSPENFLQQRRISLKLRRLFDWVLSAENNQSMKNDLENLLEQNAHSIFIKLSISSCYRSTSIIYRLFIVIRIDKRSNDLFHRVQYV